MNVLNATIVAEIVAVNNLMFFRLLTEERWVVYSDVAITVCWTELVPCHSRYSDLYMLTHSAEVMQCQPYTHSISKRYCRHLICEESPL